MWLAATNSFSLGSGLGTHCNRKRRLNAAVLRARLLLSPHKSHLESAPGVSGSLWFSFTRCRAMYAARSRGGPPLLPWGGGSVWPENACVMPNSKTRLSKSLASKNPFNGFLK